MSKASASKPVASKPTANSTEAGKTQSVDHKFAAAAAEATKAAANYSAAAIQVKQARGTMRRALKELSGLDEGKADRFFQYELNRQLFAINEKIEAATVFQSTADVIAALNLQKSVLAAQLQLFCAHDHCVAYTYTYEPTAEEAAVRVFADSGLQSTIMICRECGARKD